MNHARHTPMGLEFAAEAELTRLVHSTPALQIQVLQ
jgi:hypothetical protein